MIDVTGADLSDIAELTRRSHAARQTPTPPKTTITAKQARREAMIEIGRQSVASRERVFTNFPHVPANPHNRFFGLLVKFVRGHVTENDLRITRHLKTGEYVQMTVGEIFDEIERMDDFHLALREHDQTWRDKINIIYNDPAKTDAEKAAEIDAIQIPEFLDVDEMSTETMLVKRGGNG